MSDTIPAPGADKPADTPASEVKTPAAGKTELAPQADKPAGKDEQQTALKPEGETQEKPDDAESRRKARNRERWQAMKQERVTAIQRAERAEADDQADADAGEGLDLGQQLQLVHVVFLSVSLQVDGDGGAPAGREAVSGARAPSRGTRRSAP